MKLTPPHPDVELPAGLAPWLETFVREALRDTYVLRENGADEAAAARSALINKLLAAASGWLDAEIDVAEAAQTTGLCEESIRRAVREGFLPDRRANLRGKHRIRRGDLQKFATRRGRSYDPNADAQDIARRRRQFP